MTKIQKVVRDIQNLQDFYKRTKLLRARIKKKDLERSKVEQGVRYQNNKFRALVNKWKKLDSNQEL
jgi:chromosome condensin MukBEF MukE localization factor